MVMRNAMDSLTGNGLCVPKKAYEEHGYWDERIEGYGGDDTEVIARLYYKGYVCWSIPAAMIFHHYHKSSDSVNYKKVLKMIKEYAK
jgi:GT2 family glycosyltransferase